jgi:hypothetical protein
MNEIICPHCHKAFKVDEAGFADILKQVRDHQFEQELREHVELLSGTNSAPSSSLRPIPKTSSWPKPRAKTPNLHHFGPIKTSP